MDTKITGPYKIEWSGENRTARITGPDFTGPWKKELVAIHQCVDMNAAYAAGQAASPPTLHIGMEENEPAAWMRKWHSEGIDVMSLKKNERPRGWMFYDVTKAKLMDDDIPLFANSHTNAVTVDQLVDIADDCTEMQDGDGSYVVQVINLDKFKSALLKLTKQ